MKDSNRNPREVPPSRDETLQPTKREEEDSSNAPSRDWVEGPTSDKTNDRPA